MKKNVTYINQQNIIIQYKNKIIYNSTISRFKFKFNSNIIKVQDVITYLAKSVNILDIQIESSPIEEVIAKIRGLSVISLREMKKMRTYDIIDYVKSKKRASLTELMEKFGVSSATIHRDVAELVASGHLERIRGGVAFFARAANPASANGGISYLDRATVNQTAKKRIAVKAVELVADGLEEESGKNRAVNSA